MTNHPSEAPLEPESPQPLRRPSPLSHFPHPTPHINTTTPPAAASQPTLLIRENWN